MKAALQRHPVRQIRQGWVAEYKGGYKKYNALDEKSANHPIEKVGERLRSLMPWMKKTFHQRCAAAY